MKLDHVFICVEDLASAEAKLSASGLRFTRRSRHPGQGTHNACAHFENGFLELLACERESELDADAVRPLKLRERFGWRTTGASPFGVAVVEENGLAAAWRYAAPYLPEGSSLPMISPARAAALPLVFQVPPGSARAGEGRLTRISIHGPGIGQPAAIDLVEWTDAAEHRMEIEVDGGASGRVDDLRPDLPLILRR